MKKIIYLITVLGISLGAVSCNLDMNPRTSAMIDTTYTEEYCQGMRAAIYNTAKSYISGGSYVVPDLYVDVLNCTVNATKGNQGRFIHSWSITLDDADVAGAWGSFFGGVYQVNVVLDHIQKTLDMNVLTEREVEQVTGYMGEMYMFRAWIMYRAAMLFCEQPAMTDAELEAQLGLYYQKPLREDGKPGFPDVTIQPVRGTLKELLANIEEDIARAEAILTDTGDYMGKQGSIYLTADAVKAFKAQYALYRRDYATAAQMADELIASGRYPLVQTEAALEMMWRQDVSTENIVQLDLVRTTMGTAGGYDTYVSATYDKESNTFRCSPWFVPEQQIVDLFVAGDNRYGQYITVPVPYDEDAIAYETPEGKEGLLGGTPSAIYVDDTEFSIGGSMISKYLGNVNFQLNSTLFTYVVKPKMFRIAEMYLIAAEAHFRLSGDALVPLNELRRSRGLAGLTGISGDELWTEIKNERQRELVAEGGRLFDLKRWDEGFQREVQPRLLADGIVDELATTYDHEMQQDAPSVVPTHYVWPVPIGEIARNENMKQNPGY